MSGNERGRYPRSMDADARGTERRFRVAAGPWQGRRARQIAGWVATCCALLVTGCATNPATGKKQLNFYSEAQEIQLGRDADREISAQMGLVDDPELQAYVQRLGGRLAALSERPNLPWSFKVMDDPIVNAFALPGGFIYVTRGILAHMGSEAELVSVIGHEIGHVTAQHGVNQLSKQQVAQGGLMVGMIALPEIAAASDLAAAGLGVLFLKYGRDDERQADDLGLRYLAGAGYETREMPEMFKVLERAGGGGGGGRIPSWLSTHPDPGARRVRSESLIAERKYPPGEIGREPFFAQLENLAFGADPRLGYFEKEVFYHPELRFRIRFPAGWKTANETTRVVGVHPERQALVELTLARAASVDEAVRAFVEQSGITVRGSGSAVRLNGLPAARADFTVARQSGSELAGRALFVAVGDKVFNLLGLTTAERWSALEPTLGAALGSFAELTDRARLDVAPQRLEIVRLPVAMTFEEVLARYPSEASRETLMAVNQVDDPKHSLPAGTPIKRIVGRRVGD